MRFVIKANSLVSLVLAAMGSLVIAGALNAEADEALPPAVAWVDENTQAPHEARFVGAYEVQEPLIGVDPLTYSPDYEWPYQQVPTGEARVYSFQEKGDYLITQVMLVFSDDALVCGENIGVMGVDAGTGAFLTRSQAEELDEIGARDEDWILNKALEDDHFARFVNLPSGAKFPMFSTGLGDGGYPYAALKNAKGEIVALYVDFWGKDEEGNWLLPNECS